MPKIWFLPLLFCLFATSAFAGFSGESKCDSVLGGRQPRVKSGFVFQRDGLPIYYKFYRIRNPKSVIVIPNGLVYELSHYEKFAKELNKAGYSVVVYAHRAQHQSEEKARQMGLDLVRFTYLNLTDDLEDLLEGLRITDPIDLASISFGTAIAAEFARRHPGRVRTLNFLAPLIRVARPYVIVRSMKAAMRAFNPFLVPILPDPQEPYELMVTAVQEFDLSKYNFEVPTAIFLAGEESEKLRPQQNEYWELHLSLQNGTRIDIREATHLMPSSAPRELAKALVNFIESVKK